MENEIVIVVYAFKTNNLKDEEAAESEAGEEPIIHWINGYSPYIGQEKARQPYPLAKYVFLYVRTYMVCCKNA